MASCPQCGRSVSLWTRDLASGLCADCRTGVVVTPTESVTGGLRGVHAGSAGFCFAAGIVLVVIGLNYLLNPSEGGDLLGREVVNLQRLYIGQTATICGAIFVAVGARPRTN
jgi:hypothetical protein